MDADTFGYQEWDRLRQQLKDAAAAIAARSHQAGLPGWDAGPWSFIVTVDNDGRSFLQAIHGDLVSHLADHGIFDPNWEKTAV